MIDRPTIGEKVTVVSGIYKGQAARIEAITDAPIPLGTTIPGQPFFIWFRPEEVERIS